MQARGKGWGEQGKDGGEGMDRWMDRWVEGWMDGHRQEANGRKEKKERERKRAPG